MSDGDLAFTSIADLGRLIASRTVSPVEVTRAALARAEALEPRLNAFITLLPESALAEARQAESEIARGELRGPLHGVPLGLKDLFWTRGVRTTAASKVLSGFVPDENGAVAERLRVAGAIIVGKTNMVEFAYGPTDCYQPEFGPTRNPWDLGRFPGGSSTGSGAAVAAGVLPGAMGSDTGGSIRNPACFCGITGLKPTYGLVSMYGAVALSTTLDHMGPLARSAEDCAIILQAVAGRDPRDRYSKRSPRVQYAVELAGGVRGLRLGKPTEVFFDDLAPGIGEAVEAAARAFVELGAEVVPVELSGLAEDTLTTMTLLRAEASAYHRRDIETRPDDYTPEIRQKLLDGLQISAVDYLAAEAARHRVRQTLKRVLDGGVDGFITPTRDTTAPRMAEDGRVLDVIPHVAAGRASPTLPFNAAGLPAISIPCGFDAQGLPIGLQLAAGPFKDALVLRLAHTYQQATDWHSRRPPVNAG